jgi:hypothetical protein
MDVTLKPPAGCTDMMSHPDCEEPSPMALLADVLAATVGTVNASKSRRMG